MEGQHEVEINLEMDIADFSGKTVKRIDIQNIVSRTAAHEAGVAVVISFIDGATGTILVKARQARIIIAPYARPRMNDYSIVEEDEVAPVP